MDPEWWFVIVGMVTFAILIAGYLWFEFGNDDSFPIN